MSINLDKIRDELSVVSLARDLGLEMGTKNARCFNSEAHKHNDKSYSLSFDSKRNRFKCFACGTGGSTIDLYAGVKGVDVKVAMNELWDLYFDGDKTPLLLKFNYQETKDIMSTKRLERATLISKFSEIYEALMFYCRGLDLASQTYLMGPDRGLSQKTIEKFNLFSIRNYQSCVDFLTKGWSAEDLRMSGLFSESGTFIFYKHTLIIPFYENKRIVFLQGRRLDGEHPKYLQMSGVEVPLFNVDTIRSRKKTGPLFICEGVFDAIMLEQEGQSAVAVLGVNNFKEQQIEWVKSLNRPIKILFDNDEAGQVAAGKIVLDLMFEGVDATMGNLPKEYKDVTEFYLAQQKLKN